MVCSFVFTYVLILKKQKHETTPFPLPLPFALPCMGTIPEQWQSKDNIG